MATTKLVEKIRQILSEDSRYASAWLTYNDDLTGRERYVLHVKPQEDVSSLFGEMNAIQDQLLDRLSTEEMRLISRVDVHNFNEPIQGWNEDIIVLEKDEVL